MTELGLPVAIDDWQPRRADLYRGRSPLPRVLQLLCGLARPAVGRPSHTVGAHRYGRTSTPRPRDPAVDFCVDLKGRERTISP